MSTTAPTFTPSTATADQLAACASSDRVVWLSDGDPMVGDLAALARDYASAHYAGAQIDLPAMVRVRWGAWDGADYATVYFTRDDLIDPRVDLADLPSDTFGTAWATVRIDGRA